MFHGTVAASMGGFLAVHYGFDMVFILTSIMSFIGTGFLFFVKKYTISGSAKVASDTIKV